MKIGDGMKKGFTLVELLAVITIIGVVALIVFPKIINSIKQSKEDLYQIQVHDIESAGKKWATDHLDFLDSNHLNATGVSLDTLIESNYFQKNNVQDPRNKEKMNGCIQISYNETNQQYQYQYIEDTCQKVIANGYIYTYQDENWIKTEQNVIIPATTSIVNDYINNGLIKVEGQTTAGLYDDSTRYVFRGDSVNNYLKLNGGSEIYRILSIDKKTQTMRIMGTTPIPNTWDNDGNLLFENASVSTVQLENYYNSSNSGIMNNYTKIETNVLWNVGEVTGPTSYTILKSLEAGRTAYGKAGLPSLSDYVGASTTRSCHNSFTNCIEQNYLYDLWQGKNTWLMNTNGVGVWYIDTAGAFQTSETTSIYYIYPVIEVKANAYLISGDGKLNSPYILK